MNIRRLSLLAVAGISLGLSGCTLPSSGRTLSPGQVGQLQKVTVATIIKVKEVAIDGSRTSMGQYGGAVLGGAAAMPRGGVGSALAVAGASVVGAIAGQSIEEYVTRKKAQEITVQMADGDVFVIVQESPPSFQVGDKVNVYNGPNGARLEMALDF